MRNICIVAGARPNFIKVAPIMRALKAARDGGEAVEYTLVYAGNEDDPTLEGTLFEDLQMERPTVYLGVDCENLNELTGRVMAEFEHYLNTHPTDIVVVVDDLASTMAVAIVTKKKGIRLAHLVAGTRSFDINMPKEINRLVIDGLSDLMFTAGVKSDGIAKRNGMEQSQVYMVGNLLIDTLRHNYPRFTRPKILNDMGIEDGKYIVLTLNRKALLEDNNSSTFEFFFMIEKMLREIGDIPVIAPLRGRAKMVFEDLMKEWEEANAFDSEAKGEKSNYFNFPLVITEPMSYLDFGYLTSHAMAVVTDSGNVAEEATFNNVPCITLNDYTEHIETINQGTNVLIGEDVDKLLESIRLIKAGKWKQATLPERWDGRTAERIVKILLS